MRRAWAELRGPVSALVLFGIVARLLLPLPAFAAMERAAFDTLLRSSLCLPSGQPGPSGDEGAPHAAPATHCPLCRLPDGAWAPPPDAAPIPPVLGRLEQARPPGRPPVPVPPSRGPPPARAPPVSPNIG